MNTERVQIAVDYDADLAKMVQTGYEPKTHVWIDVLALESVAGIVRKGEHQLEAVLVHIGRGVTTEEASAELDMMGLRVGDVHELLALGAQHPSLQLKFRIAGLGSVLLDTCGYRRAPRLGCHEGVAGLYSGLAYWVWPDQERFLAFAK